MGSADWPIYCASGCNIMLHQLGRHCRHLLQVVIPNDDSKCDRYGVAAKAVDCAPVLVAKLAPGAAKPAAKGKENASKGALPPLAKPVIFSLGSLQKS